MERIYKPILEYSKDEIISIIERNELEELISLPFSVGMFCDDWKFAQSICVELANNKNELVRANAIFGFAHIARTKGVLEKHIVKPIILKELRENIKYKDRIIDAIGDINLFMKWNLAKKHLEEILY